MASRPSNVGGYIPILPASFPPLVRRPTASRRHFCAHGQQSGARLKTKTAINAICRPATAFYALVAIPIFPHRKTAHRGNHGPAQGIKQPRPTPRGIQVIPLTWEAAREWAEGHLDADKYQEVFGEVEEDESRTVITLSMSAGAVERAKRAAAQANISLSAYIESRV